ncbi:CoA pyrophosphatase [Marinilabiliaceae bacterium ANBcel2]|nr:CoA pyrophosphatase [Marinilabiliaceae bacterium ANBcel2]
MIRVYEILKNLLASSLPGEPAQNLMSPSVRFTGSVMPCKDLMRSSSVLLLLYPKNGKVYFPLIKRPNYPGVHGGQVSLPGGGCEECDNSYWETSLRESNEELGITTRDILFAGALSPLYIPNSNYMVYPQVGIATKELLFYPDRDEVDEVIELPLSVLFDNKYKSHFTCNINGHNIEAPCYLYKDRAVWGATAMMLSEFAVLSSKESCTITNLTHSCND